MPPQPRRLRRPGTVVTKVSSTGDFCVNCLPNANLFAEFPRKSLITEVLSLRTKECVQRYLRGHAKSATCRDNTNRRTIVLLCTIVAVQNRAMMEQSGLSTGRWLRYARNARFTSQAPASRPILPDPLAKTASTLKSLAALQGPTAVADTASRGCRLGISGRFRFRESHEDDGSVESLFRGFWGADIGVSSPGNGATE
jgi:hypothetical protein